MADNYSVLYDAIEKRLCISATYNRYVREMCPHVLGTKNGKTQCLFFQFAGGSSKGLSPGGEWRCIPIAGLVIHTVYAGPWHTDANYNSDQTCVDSIDIAVPF